jgi:flagellar assembly factor FliW
VPSWVLRLVSWNEGDDTRDVGAFLILNVNDGELTANLRAPVVVNIRKRLAFQMILDDMEIPIQHPIRPEEKPSDSP